MVLYMLFVNPESACLFQNALLDFATQFHKGAVKVPLSAHVL